MNYGYRIAIVLFTCLVIGSNVRDVASTQQQGEATQVSRPPTVQTGQATVPLPDGTWLVTGARTDGSRITATIWDPVTGTTSSVPSGSGLVHPRTGHTATMMRDGRVLILGGVNTRGEIESTAEYYDPASGHFQETRVPVEPRAYHSATLLTDGRLLVTGGATSDGQVRDTAQVWDPSLSVVQTIPMYGPRRGHVATLLDDGSVAVGGGIGGDGKPVSVNEIYFPISGSFVPGSPNPIATDAVFLAASQPAAGATTVPVDGWIALRFSDRLRVRTINAQTITLSSEQGPVDIVVTAAEEGRLVFVTPRNRLSPVTTYHVSVLGVIADRSPSNLVTRTEVTFTTADVDKKQDSLDDEEWTPGADAIQRGWKTDRAESPWTKLPPLQAAPGETALAGQVLLLNGKPLADVTLEVDGHSARTDRTGRFLITLQGTPSGHKELRIDGTSVSRSEKTYGIFEARVRLVASTTMVLPYTIWMPKIDTAHSITIPSPTTDETIVTTPLIPGLELHLAKGTVIRGERGDVVRELSITPIPVDRPPFPLPQDTEVPIYFTIQPGGAYLHVYGSSGIKGARLVYPNYTNQKPGTRMTFWHYDPDSPRGWNVYGEGRVTSTGTQVVPDAGVWIYAFTGAMIASTPTPPVSGPPPGGDPPDADPVDLATGLFVYARTDLFLPDTIPIALARTYRPVDSVSRTFGIGTTNPYAMTLYSTQNYEWADLILPDGARIYYERTSSGTGFLDAVYEHTTTPTQYLKSTLSWNTADGGWNLRLKDGTVYVFGDNAPLQKIRDRFGNVLKIEHSNGPIGNVTRVLSPHNRWMAFTYDGSNRVTQATDNLGRTVGYTYNAFGELWKVTDAGGGVTEYTYDTSHRMLTVKDPRGIVYVTNQYDSNGRVSQQTLADGGIYEFEYTLSSGKVTQTDVRDPEGNVRRTTFNADGYSLTHVEALGTTLERTTTFTRTSGANLLATSVDALSRETDYTYDSNGNLTSMVRLAGTADETTTTFTFEPTFNQATTVTDPLSHMTTLTYDTAGHLTTLTDPLNHQTSLTYNSEGQLLTVRDALSHTTTLGYELGEVTTVTNPLMQTTTRLFDGAGQILATVSPLGQTTRAEYDAMNQITKLTDPLGGETTFTYDGNGNLLTLTDSRGKTTTWTYDDMDRVATRTDPLNRQESFAYDLNGRVATRTDRKGQVTSFTYDALGRLTFTGFDTTGAPPSYASTITRTYDAGDRVIELVDSGSGTISRTYDMSDRLTQEETAEGTIDYTYDEGGRRTTMQVDGQTGVSYDYDNANRLTGVNQGTAAVTLGYDSANRRTSLTLPNGVVVEYGYNDGSRLTGLAYKLAGTPFGGLEYAYDANGQRTVVTGSYARSGLPAAVSSATYDDANQVTTFGGTTFTHDDNGNLTSDNVRSYTWNPRNELSSVSGPVSGSFGYDALGRRYTKTIGSITTHFLYDGVNPVQELLGGGGIATILAGLRVDERFVRTDTNGTASILADALGSTIALTSDAATVLTEYSFEPFGTTTASGSASTNAYAFTGREEDSTGLYYYRARYYDPGSTRFISEDPIGFKGGWNLYSYVLNNPVSYRDPFGLMRNCYQEQIDCFRECWNKCPPWPYKRGDKGHYKYCQTKCLLEYLACEAANEAERMAQACASNPVVCAAVVLGGAVIAAQPETSVIVVPALNGIR